MFKQASVALVVAGALLGAAQAQSLRFFSWYGTETQTFNDEFVKRASAVAPGVKLEVEPVVWDQMHPLLQSRIAAGNIPDILDFKGQDISRYAPGGNLLDLTGQPWLKNIPASARANLKVNGKEYGVPYSSLFQGVFYNRKIFAKYNLKAPKTYTELMSVARVLQRNNVTPFAAHFKDDWNIGNITMQFAMADVFSGNPNWGRDLYAGKVKFETSVGYRRVFQRVKDIYDNSWKDAFSVDFTEASKRFVKGEAAMFVTGTWINSNLAVDPSFDYGIFPFPGAAAGAKLIFEPNHTWAIAANTKNKEAALKILEMVSTDKQLAAILVKEAGTYSLLSGVKSDKSYPVDSDIEAYKDADQIIDVSIGNTQIKWAYQVEYSKYIAEWILGKRSLDDALKAATAFRAKLPLN